MPPTAIPGTRTTQTSAPARGSWRTVPGHRNAPRPVKLGVDDRLLGPQGGIPMSRRDRSTTRTGQIHLCAVCVADAGGYHAAG